jgi:hypothetical protein
MRSSSARQCGLAMRQGRPALESHKVLSRSNWTTERVRLAFQLLMPIRIRAILSLYYFGHPFGF